MYLTAGKVKASLQYIGLINWITAMMKAPKAQEPRWKRKTLYTAGQKALRLPFSLLGVKNQI